MSIQRRLRSVREAPGGRDRGRNRRAERRPSGSSSRRVRSTRAQASSVLAPVEHARNHAPPVRGGAPGGERNDCLLEIRRAAFVSVPHLRHEPVVGRQPIHVQRPLTCRHADDPLPRAAHIHGDQRVKRGRGLSVHGRHANSSGPGPSPGSTTNQIYQCDASRSVAGRPGSPRLHNICTQRGSTSRPSVRARVAECSGAGDTSGDGAAGDAT